MSDERYKSNSGFRDDVKKRSRLQYWQTKPLVQRPDPEIFKTGFYHTLKIENPEDARVGQELTAMLYKSGSLAKMLDISTQSLRQWERRGFIPDSGFRLSKSPSGDKTIRAYTYAQMMAVYELLHLLNFTDDRGQEFGPFSKMLKERWAAMPDGVVVEPKES